TGQAFHRTAGADLGAAVGSTRWRDRSGRDADGQEPAGALSVAARRGAGAGAVLGPGARVPDAGHGRIVGRFQGEHQPGEPVGGPGDGAARGAREFELPDPPPAPPAAAAAVGLDPILDAGAGAGAGFRARRRGVGVGDAFPLVGWAERASLARPTTGAEWWAS